MINIKMLYSRVQCEIVPGCFYVGLVICFMACGKYSKKNVNTLDVFLKQ